MIVNSAIVVSNILSSFDCLSGGTISFDVSGGSPNYQFSLFSAINNTVILPASSNSTITGLIEGSYIIQVADAVGCSTQFLIDIVNPNPISVETTVTNDCLANGTITVNA
ncbi:MAG: hypothetical protein HC854_07295, partial [Flavobacterium sp.]|nr:hypothetical protein [Flavobacterium sp.]